MWKQHVLEEKYRKMEIWWQRLYWKNRFYTTFVFAPKPFTNVLMPHPYHLITTYNLFETGQFSHDSHQKTCFKRVYNIFYCKERITRHAKYLLQPDFVHNRNRLPEKMFPPETYSQQKTSHTKPISNQKQLAAIIFCSATKNIGTHHERKFQTKFDDAKCFCIWIHWLQKMLTI